MRIAEGPQRKVLARNVRVEKILACQQRAQLPPTPSSSSVSGILSPSGAHSPFCRKRCASVGRKCASCIFPVPMAEHTMGLLVALARNFPDSVRHQDRSQWGQQDLWDKPQRLTELNGRLLLIVGYGSIGRELARRAHAFDMRVWGVTRSGKGDANYAEKIVPVAQLDEVLPEADYVVVAAPETAETAQLMNSARIARMKRGARLINVGRGSLLDEAALLRALESGALAGVALDVTATEPLPPDSPLWKAPNLFITPHTSGISDRLWIRQANILVQLLERWFDGRDLFNQVDFTRGY